jgi:soluble lytic murein transglycosylase-like protein
LPPPGGDCSLSANYPQTIRQWCPYIEKHAAENGISPSLVAAVMLQESGGNASAYSSSGAVGLLQVMASDGASASFMCSGAPCFANRPSMSQLYDPDFNISYGARMLAELITKNGGSIREALKSYGPMDRGYAYADMVLSIYNGY